MVNSAEFANRLQKILDFYGLSAAALSEKLEFNRSTISHLLSGRNKPSLEFVMKLLKQFPDVELYWLLNGSGSFPSTPKLEKEIPSPSSSSISEKTEISEETPLHLKKSENREEIERIVIFYKDGSFKSYET
ncbi:MAG: helix-turn-helix transcriptional regulator [Flavobacteriaceae bacterium]|nr:helix-turn-helix transcriptional regulator [Flavobacteriaceae bacterium]